MSKSRHSTVSSLPRGSGEAPAPSEPAFLAVGRVLRPHALNGELRVEIHTDYPERFAHHKQLYLGPEHAPYVLQGHRFHQKTVLLKFEGVDDRTQAETLRGQWVWLPIEEAVPLEEGECYLHQLLHMRVVTEDGEELGEVVDLIETGANAVFVIHGTRGEILVPDIKEVVVDVDVGARQITVRLLDGLI
jgi:16S rRNA processing protein RimM